MTEVPNDCLELEVIGRRLTKSGAIATAMSEFKPIAPGPMRRVALRWRYTMRRKFAFLFTLIAIGALAGSAAADAMVTYQYDALGRLTSISYPNGTTVTYTYDAAGNRTQRTASTQVMVLPLIGGVVIPVQH